MEILPVEGLPEIKAGDDLGGADPRCVRAADGDVVCVAQKIVSKAEGRVVRLADVDPAKDAIELAGRDGDPRRLEVILSESTGSCVRGRRS